MHSVKTRSCSLRAGTKTEIKPISLPVAISWWGTSGVWQASPYSVETRVMSHERTMNQTASISIVNTLDQWAKYIFDVTTRISDARLNRPGPFTDLRILHLQSSKHFC